MFPGKIWISILGYTRSLAFRICCFTSIRLRLNTRRTGNWSALILSCIHLKTALRTKHSGSRLKIWKFSNWGSNGSGPPGAPSLHLGASVPVSRKQLESKRTRTNHDKTRTPTTLTADRLPSPSAIPLTAGGNCCSLPAPLNGQELPWYRKTKFRTR